MSIPEILQEVDNLEKESKNLKSELLKLCWYMRGSVTIDDIYYMTYEDRMMIGKLVEDNLETTKKTGLNFF
jgi:hypothetical protein